LAFHLRKSVGICRWPKLIRECVCYVNRTTGNKSLITVNESNYHLEQYSLKFSLVNIDAENKGNK